MSDKASDQNYMVLHHPTVIPTNETLSLTVQDPEEDTGTNT